MNDTGSQVAKVAVPTAIALTGTGFFGTIVVGTIVVIGVAGVTVLVADAVREFMKTRRVRSVVEDHGTHGTVTAP